MNHFTAILVIFGALGFAEFVFHLGALFGAVFAFVVASIYASITNRKIPMRERIIVPLIHLYEDIWEANAVAVAEIFDVAPMELVGRNLEFETQWRFRPFEIHGDMGESAPLIIKLQRIPSAFVSLDSDYLRPDRTKVLDVKWVGKD